MKRDQIEALIRRYSLLGEVDADHVTEIARGRGVSGYALTQARRSLGYTKTVTTRRGRRWVK